MLMDPDTGGIDHHDVAIVALRDTGPGRARPEAPEDAVQHLPIIDPPSHRETCAAKAA